MSQQLAVRQSGTITPISHLSRLTPDKVIDAGSFTIYYFIRIKSKPGYVKSLLKDPSIARYVAMITIPSSQKTFKLQWYPFKEEAQITVDLPIEKLPEAIEDLKNAGF